MKTPHLENAACCAPLDGCCRSKAEHNSREKEPRGFRPQFKAATQSRRGASAAMFNAGGPSWLSRTCASAGCSLAKRPESDTRSSPPRTTVGARIMIGVLEGQDAIVLHRKYPISRQVSKSCGRFAVPSTPTLCWQNVGKVGHRFERSRSTSSRTRDRNAARRTTLTRVPTAY